MNQNENERKPVAAFQDTSGSKNRLIVVCDDGSAWRRLISEATATSGQKCGRSLVRRGSVRTVYARQTANLRAYPRG